MNAGWLLLVIAIAGAAVMLATSRGRRDQYGDLGTVSHHWIAEQRQDQGAHLPR